MTPIAEKNGQRLCCHPDDPPFGLLGLPRVMSTEEDYSTMMKAVDLNANGNHPVLGLARLAAGQ